MTYVIYGFAAVFLVLCAAMMFAYHRSGHFGLFLMGILYGASGALAIHLVHWWPLAAGFALVWVLKLLGLEPGAEPKDVNPKEKS